MPKRGKAIDKMYARLKDGSRRVSRCKPGDRNFGGVAIAARTRASGVWEEEKSVVGESPPIADAFAAPDHIREQKKDEGVRGGEVVVTPRKRLRLVNSRQQHFFLLLRHRMPACVPLSRHRQSSDLRACTSKPCVIRPSKRAYILSMAFPRSRTCAPSDVFRFQSGTYPDRVSRLVARAGRRCRCCVLLNQVYIRRVAKFPNPDSPGVPGSGHNWVLGAVAYIACWILWIFGVFLGYEVLCSYYRRWRFRE